MQGVPPSIAIEEVDRYLRELPGVTDVHDLHVWAMSTTEIAMTVHLVLPRENNHDAILRQASDELLHRFNIGHTTIQIERSLDDVDCGQHAEGTL